jgi:threonine dehydrogenase-like Zn-dependent dehydrogenase
MRAVCWYGSQDVRVEEVPEPRILNPHDAVIKITLTAICGSDLHLYNGYNPTMSEGDILGHEFMGEVVEVGSAVTSLRVTDRVVVPFAIACGQCFYCRRQLWSLCDNTNPNAWAAEKVYQDSTAGLFGYSHMFGGYAGGQAQYVRVPFADVGAVKIHRMFQTSSLCSSRIFCRRDTWLPRTATFTTTIRLLCGDVVPSANLPFRAPACWEHRA